MEKPHHNSIGRSVKRGVRNVNKGVKKAARTTINATADTLDKVGLHVGVHFGEQQAEEDIAQPETNTLSLAAFLKPSSQVAVEQTLYCRVEPAATQLFERVIWSCLLCPNVISMVPIQSVGPKLHRYLQFALKAFHRGDQNSSLMDLRDAALRGSRLEGAALRNGTPESVGLAVEVALRALLDRGGKNFPPRVQLSLATLSLTQLLRGARKDINMELVGALRRRIRLLRRHAVKNYTGNLLVHVEAVKGDHSDIPGTLKAHEDVKEPVTGMRVEIFHGERDAALATVAPAGTSLSNKNYPPAVLKVVSASEVKRRTAKGLSLSGNDDDDEEVAEVGSWLSLNFMRGDSELDFIYKDKVGGLHMHREVGRCSSVRSDWLMTDSTGEQDGNPASGGSGEDVSLHYAGDGHPVVCKPDIEKRAFCSFHPVHHRVQKRDVVASTLVRGLRSLTFGLGSGESSSSRPRRRSSSYFKSRRPSFHSRNKREKNSSRQERSSSDVPGVLSPSSTSIEVDNVDEDTAKTSIDSTLVLANVKVTVLMEPPIAFLFDNVLESPNPFDTADTHIGGGEVGERAGQKFVHQEYEYTLPPLNMSGENLASSESKQGKSVGCCSSQGNKSEGFASIEFPRLVANTSYDIFHADDLPVL